MDLSAKVVLITGGGSGIGAATAAYMAARGASVVLAGIPAEALERAAAEIRASGAQCIAVATDVTRDAEVQQAVAAAVDTFGRLDVVVANAGIQRHQQDRELHTLAEHEWELTQDVNLRGVVRTCKHGIARMLEQGTGGAVVIVSSITALLGMSPNVSYSSSKAALLALTRNIAVHYASAGIRCNAVCPGALEQTPDWEVHPDPRGRQATMESRIPLGRLGTSAEMAPFIALLASNEASYATGTHIVVDGGLTVA